MGHAEGEPLPEDEEVERGGVGLGAVGAGRRGVGARDGRRGQRDGDNQSGNESGGGARSHAVHQQTP